MYARVYVCMQVCIIYLQLWVYVRTYVCMDGWMHASIHPSIHPYIHTHACMHACMHCMHCMWHVCFIYVPWVWHYLVWCVWSRSDFGVVDFQWTMNFTRCKRFGTDQQGPKPEEAHNGMWHLGISWQNQHASVHAPRSWSTPTTCSTQTQN